MALLQTIENGSQKFCGAFVDGLAVGVADDIGICGRLIGVAYAGESLYFSGTGPSVEPFDVTRFTDAEWCVT